MNLSLWFQDGRQVRYVFEFDLTDPQGNGLFFVVAQDYDNWIEIVHAEYFVRALKTEPLEIFPPDSWFES